MTKLEAYQRLNQVLEQVNASIALLIASEAMKKNEDKRATTEMPKKQTKTDPSQESDFYSENSFNKSFIIREKVCRLNEIVQRVLYLKINKNK